MHENEDGTEITTASSESISQTGGSAPDGQLELLQRLADRVVRDAEELAARIRKESESEAARLVKDAGREAQEIIGRAQKQAEAAAEAEEKSSMMLQQARQKAVAIEAEATREVAQARMKVKEDIEKNLVEVVGKINSELRPSLDYLVERAKTLEAEVRVATIPIDDVDDEVDSELPAVQIPPVEIRREKVTELHSELKEAIEVVADPEFEHSPHDQNGDTGVEDEADAEPMPSQEPAELLEGKVEINIAPPVNVARLLGLTRHLENTLDIKVMQTSGSRNLGSVITVSLDKPLPLVDFLGEIPSVEEVRIVDKQEQSSGSEQNGTISILVTMGEGGGEQLRSSATPEQRSSRAWRSDIPIIPAGKRTGQWH